MEHKEFFAVVSAITQYIEQTDRDRNTPETDTQTTPHSEFERPAMNVPYNEMNRKDDENNDHQS